MKTLGQVLHEALHPNMSWALMGPEWKSLHEDAAALVKEAAQSEEPETKTGALL